MKQHLLSWALVLIASTVLVASPKVLAAVYRNLAVAVETRRTIASGPFSEEQFAAPQRNLDLQYSSGLLLATTETDAHDCVSRRDLGRVLFRAGDFDGATSALQGPCATDMLSALWLGGALLQDGDESAAMKVWGSVGNLDRLLTRLAAKAKKDGLYQSSEKLYHFALAIAPNNPKAHLDFGYLLWQWGHLESASLQFQEAARLFDGDEYQRDMTLGELARLENAYPEALEYYAAAARVMPASAEPHVQMGNMYALMKDLEDARREYELALAIDPNSEGGLLEIGELEGQLGDAAAALTYFRRAMASEPSSEYPWLYSGRLLREMGDLKQALSDLSAAYEKNHSSQTVAYELGITLLQMNDTSEAIRYLQLATALGPNYPWIQEGLIGAALASGDEAKACQYLETWRSLWPDRPPSYSLHCDRK